MSDGIVGQLVLSVIKPFNLEGTMKNMLINASLPTMMTAVLATAQTGRGGPPGARGGSPGGRRGGPPGPPPISER